MAQLQTLVSWDAALKGVLPVFGLSSVQRAPRGPVVVPDDGAPEPPGSGSQLRARGPPSRRVQVCLENTSLTGEVTPLISELVTHVNEKVTRGRRRATSRPPVFLLLLCRLDAPFALRGSAAGEHRLQEPPGMAAWLPHDRLGRAGGNDLAAAVAAFRAEVDDPVGGLDDFQIVLDDDHCVAALHQLVQHLEELGHVWKCSPVVGSSRM